MRARLLIAAVLLTAHFAPPPSAAQTRSTIVGPGVKRYPIALAPLRSVAGSAPADGRFEQVLGRDLELSGIFRVIPPDTYIDDAQTSG
ncbi:MAG: hypothetical protein ACRERC_09070, partial [Candidatus Binatia bacterium]